MRLILTFLVLLGTTLSSISNEKYECRHIYSLYSNFYYLDILPENKFKLKVGMYDNDFVIGDFEIENDTLKLKNHSFLPENYPYSNRDSMIILDYLSGYKLSDSLLLPLSLSRFPLVSAIFPRDTSRFETFALSDGHVYLKIEMAKDASYTFRHGSDKGGGREKGCWETNGEYLQLYPQDSISYLKWLCTNNRFLRIGAFLVGETFDEQDNIKEYNYLNKLKPKPVFITNQKAINDSNNRKSKPY